MLGNFFRRSTDRKQCVNKKQNVESTVLPQAETNGNARYMLGTVVLRLRQYCQFLMLAFFV